MLKEGSTKKNDEGKNEKREDKKVKGRKEETERLMKI